MPDFKLKRIGLIMEPEAGNPLEVEGVLNPAAIRGPDGQLYLFPRLVAKNNYSRIGIARVLFDSAGDPTGVERMGIALEPEAEYELTETGGGCEDPRVVYFEPLQHYAMTYTALSRHGPRIAMAVSDDLINWRRLGLATFEPYQGIAFDGIDNKDASLFPVLIPDPSGNPAVGIVHRPLFPGTRPEEKARHAPDRAPDPSIECIWISYCRLSPISEEHRNREFVAHHRLACPVGEWEYLKIGGGTPPIRCRHGWLMLYHGVQELARPHQMKRKLRYSAGAMVLSRDYPNRIVYRSPHAVLIPEGSEELTGTVEDVVFPTGIDRREDISQPDRNDVYYGMADDRIGVARLDVPAQLPQDSEGACSPGLDLSAVTPLSDAVAPR